MQHNPSLRHRRSVRGVARARPLLLAPVLLLLGGCLFHRSSELPAPSPIFMQLRELLGTDRPTAAFYDARSRLEAMGPEVDAALVVLADDESARPIARANALILLADRRTYAALPVLRRFLLGEESELLRSAAVLALQRLTPGSEEATALIRAAVGDPARTVRLNALQGLDVRDVETVRALLETEEDPQVRRVASQLVMLFEARGAPLARDRRGALRTSGPDSVPHLVFRPARTDSAGGFSTGDLRVELPTGPDVPLAAAAEVVGRVVPAFVSPDRSAVVYEVDREIRVMDLKRRASRSLGPGIAPRLIPFSGSFVFLSEVPGGRREVDGGTEFRYHVLRSGFAGGTPELLGELRAVASPERRGNFSPVRWMVVGEAPEGFVLRGEGIVDPFPLPTQVWRPGQEPGAHRIQ